MKLALFTIFRVPNFGSVLQAYATQKILEGQGHECKIIDYYAKKNIKQKIKCFFSLYSFACMFGVKPQFRKPGQLRRFINRYFNLSKKYFGTTDLSNEDWGQYDAIVVGSDQVWNYKYLGGENIFLLPFLTDNKKCFSFASSFACSSIPESMKEDYRCALSKFQAISVRESNGVDIVRNLSISREAKLILDPTLLLSGEEWMTSVGIEKNKESDPYILLYMWTYAFEPRPYIYDVLKYWQKKMDGCKILALEGSPKKQECNGLRIKDVADSTIPQFLNLFANASLVITSSFHGTAFAINYGRPLISIVPNDAADDRQVNLLRIVGANNSIIKIGSPIERINPYYALASVNEKLKLLREDNINWIKNNIR